MGPYQLKKDCPIPVISTGIDPAIKIKPVFFLFKLLFKYGWNPQKHKKKGIQLANPIQDNEWFNGKLLKWSLKFVWTVALIKRIMLAEKKHILNLSWKYPFVLKAPLNTQIKRTNADNEKAVGKKNIPIKNNLLNNVGLFSSFFTIVKSFLNIVNKGNYHKILLHRQFVFYLSNYN